jgi:hypothetical protein
VKGNEPLCTVGEKISLMQPPQKAVWRFLELKIELSYDPVIPLLGLYLKKCKLGYNRDNCTPMFIAVLFIIAKSWNQPRCPPINEQLRKFGMFTQWRIIQP